MTDPTPKYTTDNAFTGPLKGGAMEPTYGGALSFMRRRYSRDLAGVDAVVWGIPFDQATTNRPGARFGPQAIRRASAILDGDPQYPFKLDPFATLAVIDYGDAYFDFGLPMEFAATIEAQARTIIDAGAQLLSLGGDHFVTYPLLKAHAAVHGPLALVQFDAHQDTWPDHDGRISHGTFVRRAVHEGLIEAKRSIQIGIRTEAPDDCGIEILTAADIDQLGPSGIAARIKERVGEEKAYLTSPLTSIALIRRSRLAPAPRSLAACRAAKRWRFFVVSARSISSAATLSRLRPPMTMPISPLSPHLRWRCTTSACSPSADEAKTGNRRPLRDALA